MCPQHHLFLPLLGLGPPILQALPWRSHTQATHWPVGTMQARAGTCSPWPLGRIDAQDQGSCRTWGLDKGTWARQQYSHCPGL